MNIPKHNAHTSNISSLNFLLYSRENRALISHCHVCASYIHNFNSSVFYNHITLYTILVYNNPNGCAKLSAIRNIRAILSFFFLCCILLVQKCTNNMFPYIHDKRDAMTWHSTICLFTPPSPPQKYVRSYLCIHILAPRHNIYFNNKKKTIYSYLHKERIKIQSTHRFSYCSTIHVCDVMQTNVIRSTYTLIYFYII